MRREVLRGLYEAAWLIAFGMFVAGWALAFTSVGAVLVFSATVGVIALFIIHRTPVALLALTVVLSLGWFPIFFTAPWLLALPLALLVVAWRWRQQRKTANAR